MTDAATPRDQRTYALIGAAMEVHRIVGSGFGEAVCQDALAVELLLREIPFRTQVPFPIVYKGHRLTTSYRADFVCYESVIVEIKALKVRTGPLEEAQMLNYLRAASISTGLLLNFGLPSLEYRRFIMSPDRFWRSTTAV